MKENYIKKVKKALPRKFRAEVLRDLEEIFRSAAEHGETEAEVAERLGCPCEFAKEAALQLGVDLDKRKSKRRVVLFVVSAALTVFFGVLHWLASMNRRLDAAIGIIGGADGPTAIFVTGPTLSPSVLYLPAAVIAAIIALVLLGKILKKKK